MFTKLPVIAALAAAAAFAHCDSIEGPVVQAARRAILTNDVNVVLPWVRPDQEGVIRQAFDRTRSVRALGKDAEALADTWFFETVVRIHRAGEGAPYEGLKAANTVPAGIAAADSAIAKGNIDALSSTVAGAVREGLHRRYSRLQELQKYARRDVKAGRAYVAAYVDFIHFVEGLHASLARAGEHGQEHAH